ncbi:hypothetical protein [Streptomyces acidicola]|uniref:hypothetical protein n=1 Tax=Streptomyces acidicola TaxID=2596892 RepID=UPI0038120CE1
MADMTVEKKDAPAIQLIAQEQTEGYCDPVTGVCVWPGAAQADAEPQTGDKDSSPTE